MKTATILVSFMGASANAFVVHPSNPARRSAQLQNSATPQTSIPEVQQGKPKDISYGEESRKYRRDSFTHSDWVKFRADDRFIRNIRSMVFSGVYRTIGKEIMATVAIACLVIGFNCLVGEYQDWDGVTHAGLLHGDFPLLASPLTPFTLSSPSLGLLLVFRTNNSYKRWDEARKNWGMNINHTRDLVRLGSAYYERTGVPASLAKQDLDRLALATWAFVRSMKRHLSPDWEDEEAYKKELYEKLPKQQAEKLILAAHRPNRALADLSLAIEVLPMHGMRKNELHKAVTIFEDNLGSSERLLTSPVPLFYSTNTARFIVLWLFLLPLGLYGAFDDSWNHIAMIPAVATISVALFGIEELATQLEEPFTILPMQAFCDKIYSWCTEIVSWQPNDNDMFDEEYLAEVEALKKASQADDAPNGFQRAQQEDNSLLRNKDLNMMDKPAANRQNRLTSIFSVVKKS